MNETMFYLKRRNTLIITEYIGIFVIEIRNETYE